MRLAPAPCCLSSLVVWRLSFGVLFGVCLCLALCPYVSSVLPTEATRTVMLSNSSSSSVRFMYVGVRSRKARETQRESRPQKTTAAVSSAACPRPRQPGQKEVWRGRRPCGADDGGNAAGPSAADRIVDAISQCSDPAIAPIQSRPGRVPRNQTPPVHFSRDDRALKPSDQHHVAPSRAQSRARHVSPTPRSRPTLFCRRCRRGVPLSI